MGSEAIGLSTRYTVGCYVSVVYIPFFCAEIPCDDNSLEDMTTLLMDVQAVVRQLGQIRQIASSCQVEA